MRDNTAVAYVFFFNDTATTEIYTLSLHDALPISGAARPRIEPWTTSKPCSRKVGTSAACSQRASAIWPSGRSCPCRTRSEEHTSELQSRQYLVCRLLLEKKKNQISHTSVSYILYH